MQILVVDDDGATLIYLSSVLRKLGHTVVTATNGAMAFERIAEGNIQIVISDWNMPELSGIELCRKLRASNLSRYIYFILLTARDDKNSLLEGMDSGADDYLVKPVDAQELRVRLRAGERILNLEHDLEARNADLIRDVRMAAAMQRSLLPKAYESAQVTLDWVFMPSHFVAGDMLGYYPLDEVRWGFFMLDVSGHGVASALISFSVSKLLWQNQQGDQSQRKTEQLVSVHQSVMMDALNQRFCAEPESANYFITMIYGTFYADTGRVILSSAGHPAPLHWHKREESLTELNARGLPIGVIDDYRYEAESLILEPGDRLFVYSDGIVECPNPEGEQFGDERFKTFLSGLAELPIGHIRAEIEKKLYQWRGRKEMPDDVSLLILERP
jgi:sigma-B regulation protein RsbU (phosphoserine phosphatase)